MRLKQRRNVLLPQPDGPISAVTWCSGIARLMFLSAWFVPYQKFSLSTLAFGAFARAALRSSSTIESDGVSDFGALVSPCIGAAFGFWDSSGLFTSVSMALTS